MSAGLTLMKNGPKLLARNVLTLLGLTAAALATDATIQKKNFGMGTTAMIISNLKKQKMSWK